MDNPVISPSKVSKWALEEASETVTLYTWMRDRFRCATTRVGFSESIDEVNGEKAQRRSTHLNA